MIVELMFATAIAARPLAEIEKKEIANAVTEGFLDPEGARFKWPMLNDDTVYCGLVNGKNGFGAFTGYKPFMVFIKVKSGRASPDPKHSVTVVGLQDGVMNDLATQVCGKVAQQ